MAASSRKGQGATEYLVVLGAVLLVSMVVVQAVSSSSSSGVALKEQQSTTYWKSATPFSISSYTLENGLLAATVRNGLAEPLKLISVQVVDSAGTSTLWSGSAVVSGGAETTLFMRYGLNNSCKNSAGGNPFEITQITFNYDKTSVSGLKQIGDKSLAGKCAAQQGIVFRSPTPADGATASANSNVSINATIDGTTAIRLKDFGLVWNGTNTSFYDDSLVLAMNFDDVYELGERGGKVVDVSNYGNNGTIYGNTAGLWHFDEADGKAAYDESMYGNNGTLYGNTRLLWHMDENDGSTIYDESAYRNNGTCYNMGGGTGVTNCNWVSGKSGSGIAFAGVNDYIAVGNAVNPVNNKLSVELWVNYLGGSESRQFLISNYGGASWYIEIINGQARFVTYGLVGGSWTTVTSDFVTITPMTWYHIVAVWDKPMQYFYVNGVQKTPKSADHDSLSNSNLLALGRDGPSDRFYLNGTLDEVGVYGKALSADEVLSHYNAGKAKFADWTTGKSGTGLQFDGVDDYIQYNKPASLNPRNELTLEAWINPSTVGGTIIGHANTDMDAGSGYALKLSSDKLMFYAYNSTGNAYFSTLSAQNILANTWTHVAATFGPVNTTKLYVNGVLDNQSQNGLNSIKPSIYDFIIGAYGYTHATSFFNGTIDEVGVYNRTLSASEILAHYNAGRAKHADWVSNGPRNSAIMFDGVTDYVSVGNSSVFNFANNSFSISLWAKADDYTKQQHYLVKMSSFYFRQAGWGHLQGGMYVGGVERDIYSDSGLQQDVWQHLAMTWNASSALWQLYINGVNIKSSTQAGPVVTNEYPVLIGTHYVGATTYFDGSIDEVRVWNRSLSAAEVAQQYYSSLNKYAPDKWVFTSNQTFLSTGTHTYYLYANATDGSSDFTEERTLRVS